MCQPKVFKTRTTGKWEWECREHSLAVFGYDDYQEALTAAIVHKEHVPIMMTTKVTRVVLNGNPRLTHLFDQFLGELDAIKEDHDNQSIETR